MKIGIPKALLYYYYIPIWKTFFDELGFETVVSGNTSKDMLNKGIKISVQEICVPIKVFNSHVLALLEDGVDYVFLPRLISIRRKETFCPKFLGLPDMASAIFRGYEGKFISPDIVSSTDKITDYSSYSLIGKMFGIRPSQIRKALKKAECAWLSFREANMKGYTAIETLNPEGRESAVMPSNLKPHANRINIGLLGYVYNICDSFISMDIVSKFRKSGINIITFEMLGPDLPYRHLKHLRKPLFWTFSNYLLGSGYYFMNEDNIDGVIHVTAFGCGPDSYIGKMMELESEKKRKPFMTIRVDEHTGESHLITRVEAFTDMIMRKKAAQLR